MNNAKLNLTELRAELSQVVLQIHENLEAAHCIMPDDPIDPALFQDSGSGAQRYLSEASRLMDECGVSDALHLFDDGHNLKVKQRALGRLKLAAAYSSPASYLKPGHPMTVA